MTTPLLSELREPPVVGRFYMVPVVRHYPWHGRYDDWPVLGPLHNDAEIFNFSLNHYHHLDMRFLGARQSRFVAKHLPWPARSSDALDRDLALAASTIPVCSRGSELPKGRPNLKRLCCYREPTPTPIAQFLAGPMGVLEEKYGAIAHPILLRDGRKLCPHQKLDLSQFTPDADGIVTCPLHGLRVRCAVPA